MIQFLYLGRVAYDEGLRLQAELASLRFEGRIDNTLLLLEHPPVLTLGRNATRANILVSDELLASRGVTVHEINRGGDVTYHGPGQLVGYPIFDLRSFVNPNGGRFGPVDFVRMIEEALIRLCGVYGMRAGRVQGLTGVWCLADQLMPSSKSLPPAGERKIGAIGIHVSRGITSHGFAFNVTTDLDHFRLINPCGITDRPVTSLEREVADRAALPSLESIAHQAARQFGLVFGQPILAVESLTALRAQAAFSELTPEGSPKAQLAAPQVPQLAALQVPQLAAAQVVGEDTPLQVPREVERLRDPREHPVRA
jgi:lipoyl(octanoyl) transferase